MATYRVELKKRILAAFPALRIYLPPDREIVEYDPNYEVDLPEGLPNNNAETYGLSPFSTPYWDRIIVQTVPLDSNEEPIVYEFPNDPVIDPFFRKKNTETAIAGGPEVLEISGHQVAMRMRGTLWNNDGLFPEDQLADLLEVFREDAELEIITSRHFGYLNITNVALVSMSLPSSPNYSDSQAFDIELKETTSVTLNIIS